ncbi:Amino acid transporter [Operophtera brumata]|uniref:Amino acid transporter n=1 Tax=Operophtera brumata TaxID=104452 RepID=A0A0L7LCZ7_OPEBR|nr:Amino acid transporter [Operophtera brumata]
MSSVASERLFSSAGLIQTDLRNRLSPQNNLFCCLIQWSRRDVMYFQYPGELFLRMLKCLIVPLLFSSIVSAIGSLDLSLSGK